MEEAYRPPSGAYPASTASLRRTGGLEPRVLTYSTSLASFVLLVVVVIEVEVEVEVVVDTIMTLIELS